MYNQGNNIIDEQTTETYHHPLGLSGQEMFEKWLFAGIDYEPEIDYYPPVEIETCQHRTNSDNATTAIMIKSAVDQAMEAWDTTKKNQRTE